MLSVTSIKSVNNTINNISFRSGVRSNFGADVVGVTPVKQEGSFLTDFLGTVKQSPLFFETFMKRQQSIEKGLENGIQKGIDAIA